MTQPPASVPGGSTALPLTGLDGAERVLAQRVCSWMEAHSGQFVADLTEWIRIPSVADAAAAQEDAPYGPAVARMMEQVAQTASGLGLEVHRHQGYAITVGSAAALRTPAHDVIALVGHVDVVPGGAGWTGDPFVARTLAGYVVGRGTADNKGPALLNLYLVRALCDLAPELGHRLQVVLGGSEEVDMSDMTWYAANCPQPGLSVVTDAGFGVNYGQKGSLELLLTVPAGPVLSHLNVGSATNSIPDRASGALVGGAATAAALRTAAGALGISQDTVVELGDGALRLAVAGRAGHAAYPEGGVNAAVRWLALATAAGVLGADDDVAARLLLRAAATDGAGMGIAAADASGPLTVNLGTLRPAPGALVAGLDVRYPMTSDGDALISQINAWLGSCGVDCALEVREHMPSVYVAPDSPVVRCLQQAYNDVVGAEAGPYTMGGGTYSKVLLGAITFGTDFWTLPEGQAALPLSPLPDGLTALGGPHAADEGVPLRHLLAAAQIHAVALLRVTKILSSPRA